MRTKLLLCALACAACAGQAPAKPPVANTSPANAPVAKPAVAPDPEPFRANRPKPGAPAEFSYPVPDIFKLKSGLSVYLLERPSHVVAVELVVRHGASSVPPGKSGLAGLTARMLTEGTRRKSSAALAEAIESLGTSLGSDAERDDSSLSLSVLPEDLSRAFDLLAEVTTQPAFGEADFQRVRAEWLDGLRAERQDPVRLASLTAVRALLGAEDGAPVDGTLRDVEALKLSELRDFHQRAYTPDNAALIVVGPVKKAELESQLAQSFAAFRGKSGIAEPKEAPRPNFDKTRVLVIDRPSAVQTAIVAIQPGAKRSEAGHEARQVVGRILGGLFTSRLNTNLREKHAYTYGAVARPVEYRRWGAWLLSTSVRTDVTAEALDEIVHELERIADPARGAPLQDEEIARAKADLVYSLGATLEHPSRLAGVASSLFVQGLAPDYEARYPDLIRGLARDAIAKSAAGLKSSGLCVVLVGDRKKIEPKLAQRGYAVETAPPELSE